VQKKAGFESLKTFCGDGGPDWEVWKKTFKELVTGVNLHIPTHLGGHPVILEDNANICCFLLKEKVRDWELSIAEKIRSRPLSMQKEKIHSSTDSK
jgi:hypothetical protein